MPTTEHTINDALAVILRRTKRAWVSNDIVCSEAIGTLKSSGLRPDILIQEPGVSPVSVETEVQPATSVESDARSRLGNQVKATGRQILASIAVRLPERLRQKSDTALSTEIETATDFEYALFTGNTSSDWERWPSSGWLRGSPKDISILAQSAALPPTLIENAVTNFVTGVSEVAGIFNEIQETHRSSMEKIAEVLCQEDCTQTRRMAATILSDAFVFQETLAGANENLKHVKNIEEMKSAGQLTKKNIIEEWKKILKINYWAIFDISCRILVSIPSTQSKYLIEKLAEIAGQLVENSLMRSHDLTGAVFQKMISDRKFLAAYYTTPASASLMAGLILPHTEQLPSGKWGNDETLTSLMIGDFSCGTGTLLSIVYQRLGQIHELHGGDSEKTHSKMMSNSLFGCDILPAASHLTASMLSGAHPAIVYNDSHIMTLPYGRQDNEKIALGSIDLLDKQASFDVVSATSQKIGGKGISEGNTWVELPDNGFDIVIMNPPFTRATGHEANKVGVPRPMFAAFGASVEEQDLMSKEMKKLTRGTCYHGNAGEASAFVALGDRKLKFGGKIGLILPLSMVSGESWEKCRQLFRKNYRNLIILSISGNDGGLISFSADTGMGECMLIASKENSNSCNAPRSIFVTLNQTPEFPMIGTSIAWQISLNLNEGTIARLEDGPNGGTNICFGDNSIGTMIDAPLEDSGSWHIARIADMSLVQSAYQVAHRHRAWLPTIEGNEAIKLHMTTVGQLAAIGPYHSDIVGDTPNGGVRGPFVLNEDKQNTIPTYPSLWRHNASREKPIVFEADEEVVRRIPKSDEEKLIIDKKAPEIWETASHLHFNRDFQFNSQATAFQYTENKSLGGRAWISVKIDNEDFEKLAALWGNCTIGLLIHWYWSNKQQLGRGSIGKLQLEKMPILNLNNLTCVQVKCGISIFDALKYNEMKPLNEIDTDTNRHELDRRFLTECLQFSDDLLTYGGPIDLVRRKLAAEPSIVGTKNK